MKKERYQICTNCIMDTTDPDITFDENGVCNHCQKFDKNIKEKFGSNERNKNKLGAIINQIKKDGVGKEYDSIMGLSGGVDSSYMAYQVKKFGLRPLVVHIDGGWNSELAVKNIENIVKKFEFDLFTFVVDWEEMKDLQVAFLRSGVENQDIPQDHAIFAFLFNLAAKKKIKYILNGGNFATESILPTSWGYNSKDLRHLRAIHKRFGKLKLKTFPKLGFFRYHFLYPYIKKIKVIRILDFIDYNKHEAKKILQKEFNWNDYGGKHHESRFTKFFQAHYLPTRFGFDKRRAHLSSLIVSKQLSRQKAFKLMSEDLYSKNKLREDKEFVAKKLGLTCKQFDKIASSPIKSYNDYPTNFQLYNIKNQIKKILVKFGLL